MQPESCEAVEFAAVTTPWAAVFTDDTASLTDDALGTAVTAATSAFQAVVRSPVGAFCTVEAAVCTWFQAFSTDVMSDWISVDVIVDGSMFASP